MTYAGIYAAPSYGMGDAPLVNGAKEAQQNLKRMERSLKGWLKVRRRMDLAAAGAPEKVLRIPGSVPLSPTVLSKMLFSQRYATEQPLALELHTLLQQVYGKDAKLPVPNLETDPDAAVKLAEIVVRGKLADATASPEAVGLAPLIWGILVVGGAATFTGITAIRSWADVAKEREYIKCLEVGACTDYGFWLKMGVIGIGGWLIYTRVIKKRL